MKNVYTGLSLLKQELIPRWGGVFSDPVKTKILPAVLLWKEIPCFLLYFLGYLLRFPKNRNTCTGTDMAGKSLTDHRKSNKVTSVYNCFHHFINSIQLFTSYLSFYQH